MKLNFEKIFWTTISTTVTLSLLGLAGYYQNAALAYASVLSMAVGAAQLVYMKLIGARQEKAGMNEETKRAMQDLNARVATLEYGVKTRGF